MREEINKMFHEHIDKTTGAGGPPHLSHFGGSVSSSLSSASRVLSSPKAHSSRKQSPDISRSQSPQYMDDNDEYEGNMSAEEMLKTNMMCPMPCKDTIVADNDEERPSTMPAYMDSNDSNSSSSSSSSRALLPSRIRVARKTPPRPGTGTGGSSSSQRPMSSSMSRAGVMSPPASVQYNTGHTGKTPSTSSGRSHTAFASPPVSRTGSMPTSKAKGPSTLPHTRPSLYHAKSAASPLHHAPHNSTSEKVSKMKATLFGSKRSSPATTGTGVSDSPHANKDRGKAADAPSSGGLSVKRRSLRFRRRSRTDIPQLAK